ncbi:methyl-accepting chemotaxis protein [Corallococcus sp. H22C18031201]|uniref:methyl-accepting chemotaxis protein n=1 Tax=Citreicoccus inhibens TaxID=2849499 RepID=UPI000E75DF14|nr:methyl-accepting chemotaxis protein [Citreicoccus inhibens]MBU8900743.1 methyl-accepting chemotaxis protein [Citreicoccus inhibens]RJS19134.1 methyl-accepting chemotaxis protein [Corallococcus sp. H22C18031201]
MSGAPSLKGLASWTVRPSWLGSSVGLGLALLHGRLSGAVPEGTWSLFLGLVAASLMLSLGLTHLQARQALRVLHGVGEGRLSATPEHLRGALQEARAVPGKCFAFTLQGWLGGSLLVAFAFTQMAEAHASVGLRVLLVGLALGPLSALLVYLLVVRRSRVAVERIAARGLTPLEVIAAAPPRKMHIRRKLVLFTAIAVLSPSLFILDVAVTQTVETVDTWAAARTPEARAAVVARARADRGATLGLMAALVTLLVLGTAYAGGTALAEPLRSITEDATRIAQGDLRPPRVVAAEDELWAASAAFTQMQAQLGQALTQLRRAGLQISSTTEQLVATSAEQESGADEQASSLNMTSATTEELARSAQQIAGDAESVAAIAETTFAAAQTGQRGATAFLGAMQRMREGNQAIADAVVRLNKRVQQIGKVVEFINEIADKSDLLALNAELEGTKAGEVGRGFSLVAAEMRRLAENVIRSTKEIEGLIEEIRDATNGAVMATEAGLKATESGAELAAQVDEGLGLILELARQTSHAVRSISLATQQQQTGTDQLAAAMGDILRVTEQNAAATKQMVAANADLSTLSRDLKHVVDRFSLGAGEG